MELEAWWGNAGGFCEGVLILLYVFVESEASIGKLKGGLGIESQIISSTWLIDNSMLWAERINIYPLHDEVVPHFKLFQWGDIGMTQVLSAFKWLRFQSTISFPKVQSYATSPCIISFFAKHTFFRSRSWTFLYYYLKL